MTIRDILVHMDSGESCTARLEAAIQIAKDHEAHLTGLYVIPNAYYGSHHTNPEELAASAKGAFEEAAQSAGIDFGWICVDSERSGLDLPNALNLHAHYRDLLIVSQTDYEVTDRTIPHDLPEI